MEAGLIRKQKKPNFFIIFSPKFWQMSPSQPCVRFFPTLDPQVSIFISRDLDSRITAREVAAVTEWLQSGKPLHSMRDHPSHDIPLLGAAWGARLSQEAVREKWSRSWRNILKDPASRAGRERKGPDQNLLARWVWRTWGWEVVMEHDSYT